MATKQFLFSRPRIDSALATSTWMPHYWPAPVPAPSELMRGLRFALLPAAAFWSGLAVAGFWYFSAS